MPRQQVMALARQAEIGEYWRRVQIGERQRGAAKPRAVSHQLLQGFETRLRLGQGCRYAFLVRGSAVGWRAHPLDEDIPDKRAVGVVVQDGDDLIEARPTLGFGRLQCWSGEGFVHIAADGAALV